MRNSKNLIRHELIGLNAEIKDSDNASQIGLKGKVIDEKMNILVIRTKNGDKTVEKKSVEITFFIDEKKVAIDGKQLVSRPEDRIKKKIKKW
jgi:ribonuclease P protein subunit POP4